MRKIFTLILIAAAAISCGSNTYSVQGSVTPTDDLKDAVALMVNMFTGKTDTAMIVGGKFAFKGDIDTTALAMITLDKPGAQRVAFVPECRKIAVDLDSAEVTAGRLTECFNALNEAMGKATDEESFIAAITDAFKANKTNGVGLYALSNILHEMESPAELDEYLDGAADFIVNNERVQAARTALQAVDETCAGKPFKEIAGEDAAGSPLALSDFAGKGKYVLIDFWASWCGPCRREIPNLVAIDKDYAKKGVQVLGINVWDEKEKGLKAVENLGIKYPVIYVADRSATDTYGVQGIPQIILIGPDGTILERNLRGEGIAQAIDKYVK
ncbi:MAG: AhpC/TSA family protein [Bacteroidales bacterium]|nr:AhpC/TSA family protein [Bacteroidales bacterium]